jgi:hypothetical protein
MNKNNKHITFTLKTSIVVGLPNTLNTEDYCLLGCKAMQSGRSLPLFQRKLLSLSLVYEMKMKATEFFKIL